jgi:hypothetical protein
VLCQLDPLTVCAISSRYYPEKAEIYPVAMRFAKHAAANALIDGWKSVELCQAYILMSVFAVPARRWEEDRSWLYTGLAIRCVFLLFCSPRQLNLFHIVCMGGVCAGTARLTCAFGIRVCAGWRQTLIYIKPLKLSRRARSRSVRSCELS